MHIQKLFPFLFLLLSYPILKAQTIQWDGGGDGINWTDPLNWDSDNIPDANDDVLIDISNVTLNTNTTIRSLKLTGGSINGTTKLIVNNSTLTINGDPLSSNSGIELVGYTTELFIDELSTVQINNPGQKGVDMQPETRVLIEGNLIIDQVANDDGLSISGDFTFLIVDGNLSITNVMSGNYLSIDNQALLMGGGIINIPTLTIGVASDIQGEISSGNFGSSTDTMLINGNLMFESISEYSLNLNGFADVPGLNNDLINVDGDLHLDGTLKVSNNTPINDGNTYTILTYTGSLTGTFEHLILPQGLGGFEIDYSVPGEIRLVDICTGVIFENTFNRDGDGVSWEDPDNWSMDHVPTICESVIIDNPNNSPPVELSSVSNVPFLYIKNGTLNINANGELHVDYNLYVNGGDGNSSGEPISLLGNSHLVNHGSITVVNAFQRGIEIGTDYASGGVPSPSTFINHGNVSIEYTGKFGLSSSNSGSFENNGQVDIVSNSTENLNSGITIKPDFRNSFLNNGVINISNIDGNSSRGINVSGFGFTNGATGSISISDLGSSVYGIFNLGRVTNEGSINLQAMNSIRAISNRSAFENLSSGVISSDYDITNSDSLRNDGQIILSNGAELRSEYVLTAGIYYGNGSCDGIFKNASSTGNAHLYPGHSIGQLSFTGLLDLHANSSLRSKVFMELAGTDGGGSATGHDSIHVEGDLELGGLLEISSLNGFAPGTSDTFTIISYSGNLSGVFNELEFKDGLNYLSIDYSVPGKILIYSSCQSETNTWLGGGGNNYWNNAANWSHGIPNPCQDVLIDNGIVVLPNSANFDINVASLTLKDGADLFIGQTNSLNIVGTVSSKSSGLFVDVSTLTSFSDINISFTNRNGIYNETGEINSNRFIRINNFNTNSNLSGAAITNTEAAIFNQQTFSIDIDLGNSNDNTSGVENTTDAIFNNDGAINFLNMHASSSYGIYNDEGTFNSKSIRFINPQVTNGIWNRFGTFSTKNEINDYSNKVNFQNDYTLTATNLIKVDTFFNKGTIIPGNTDLGSPIGSINFESNLIFLPTSLLEMEIDGNMGPGLMDGNDHINCSEDLSLNGELEIQLNPSYVPQALDTFVLFEYSEQLIGTFSTVTLPPALAAFTVDYGSAVPGKILLIYDCSIPNEFLGSMNNLWEEQANWSKSMVPLKCEKVLINNKIVNLSGTEEIHQLEIIGGGYLSLGSNAHLTINPDTLSSIGSLLKTDKSSLFIFSGGILNINARNTKAVEITSLSSVTNKGSIIVSQIDQLPMVSITVESSVINSGIFQIRGSLNQSAPHLFLDNNSMFNNVGQLELLDL